jgi:hypothetical protein
MTNPEQSSGILLGSRIFHAFIHIYIGRVYRTSTTNSSLLTVLTFDRPHNLIMSASILGMAVLENPRHVDGKKWVFDAQFYLNTSQTLVAALQYFNVNSMQFDDMGSYFVYANVRDSLCLRFPCIVDHLLQVARITDGAEIHSNCLTIQDYQLVGDIVWVRMHCSCYYIAPFTDKSVSSCFLSTLRISGKGLTSTFAAPPRIQTRPTPCLISTHRSTLLQRNNCLEKCAFSLLACLSPTRRSIKRRSLFPTWTPMLLLPVLCVVST